MKESYQNLREKLRGKYRQLQEIQAKEDAKEAIVIRPPESLRIGRACKKPEELERVYQIGRAEATRRLPEIRKFLGQ